MNDILYDNVGKYITVIFPQGKLTGIYLTCSNASQDTYRLHFKPGITMYIPGRCLTPVANAGPEAAFRLID
jgi:hypothetical protein